MARTKDKRTEAPYPESRALGSVMDYDAARPDAIDEHFARVAREVGRIETSEDMFPGLTRDENQRHLNRMLKVVELQQAIGSFEERSKLDASLEAAEKALNTKGVKLAEQIEALQTELNGLQAEARNTRAAVASRDAAISELARYVPRHVRDKCDAQRRIANVNRDWLQHSSRLKTCEAVLALNFDDINDRLSFRNHCDGHRRKDLIRDYANATFHEGGVKTYLESLRAEAGRIRPLVEAGQAEHAAELAAIEERQRNFYLPE